MIQTYKIKHRIAAGNPAADMKRVQQLRQRVGQSLWQSDKAVFSFCSGLPVKIEH
jgi:hypothetical protein